jgi:hypothetical protein
MLHKDVRKVAFAVSFVSLTYLGYCAFLAQFCTLILHDVEAAHCRSNTVTYGPVATPMSPVSDAGAAWSHGIYSIGFAFRLEMLARHRCGTGALSAAILERTSPQTLLGIDPSDNFVAHAERAITDLRATFRVGDAQQLPVDDATLDVAVAVSRSSM